MLCLLREQSFAIAAFFAAAVPLLLIFSPSEAAVEVGKVQCIVIVNFTETFHDAHRTCWEQREKEHNDDKEPKDKEHKEKKGKHHKPFPWNATIEEFEFDDNCQEHCVYKTAGILSADETLPDKKDTSIIFSKGKTSDGHYKAITATWDECLDMSAQIGKKKDWDKCKIVTHHQHCFMRKMHDAMNKLQIDC